MRIVPGNVGRIVATRVILAWAGLSVLAGAVTLYFETGRVSRYLKKLADGAIPLGARIFAIIDVFDALTSRRPYKDSLPFDEAMAVLERGRGTHFDPLFLDEFRAVAAEIYGRITGLDDSALRQCVRSQVAEHFRLADAAIPD